MVCVYIYITVYSLSNVVAIRPVAIVMMTVSKVCKSDQPIFIGPGM